MTTVEKLQHLAEAHGDNLYDLIGMNVTKTLVPSIPQTFKILEDNGYDTKIEKRTYCHDKLYTVSKNGKELFRISSDAKYRSLKAARFALEELKL